MKLPGIHRRVLRAILSGTYSQTELHEFVQICYALALPCIRKKIALGKINLDIIGLRETDIVQDCLADLFRRDGSLLFPEISRFFERALPDQDGATDERIMLKLRQLVLGKCNNNLIRLYAEADPTLGKIIRNITLAMDRTELFGKCNRFGETHLVARGQDTLPHLPPIPVQHLCEMFSSAAHARDTIPQMIRNLHAVLVEQRGYQRTVPLVGVALMFKEIYAHGAEEPGPSPEYSGEAADTRVSIDAVVRQFEKQMYRKYVESGKRSAEVFHGYMLALNEFLIDRFVNGDSEDTSYFDYLKRQMPGLTKPTYMKRHRSVFEYLAKAVKEQTAARLRKTVRDDGHV